MKGIDEFPGAEDRPEIGDWVITILHRRDVEHGLHRVATMVKEQGLELDLIHALSHVMPDGFLRTPEGAPAYSCCEVHCYGHREEFGRDVEAAMRAELRAMAEKIDADLLLRTKKEHERAYRLFCFDMDSTLIQGETIDELAKMAGVGDQVVAITAAAMRGELQFPESFRRRVALLKGLPASRLREAIDRLPLMEGAERLFRTLQARGAKTAIFSGGFTFLGDHLQQKLGVDHVFANHLDVRGGLVTGEVTGPIVDGARKAELLQETAAREGVPLEQVVAVGDGANDLPRLALAGMGIAFHAKPVVRAAARYAMTHVGLDGLLYLLGIPDREWV
jgi:phosphoserine phosphatase